jgi:hypothetical protein
MKNFATLVWILVLGLAAAPVVIAAGAEQAEADGRITFYVA